MARLFLTGDTHGDYDFHKLTTHCFPVQKELTRDDVVVVMGDFGVCWDGGEQDRYIQSWHENKNYTTFAVRGNHDAVPLIKNLPLVDKFGGKAYQVSPHVFYAKTGELYDICGYKCLIINGADSHDKEIRIEGKNWWADETISHEDIVKAKFKLAEIDYKYDFLFSHTGGSYNTIAISPTFKPTSSDRELDEIIRISDFRCHYFGHYHVDKITFNKSHCLYNNVYEIIDGKECLQHGINYERRI